MPADTDACAMAAAFMLHMLTLWLAMVMSVIFRPKKTGISAVFCRIWKAVIYGDPLANHQNYIFR